jgi:hypothetical protein
MEVICYSKTSIKFQISQEKVNFLNTAVKTSNHKRNIYVQFSLIEFILLIVVYLKTTPIDTVIQGIYQRMARFQKLLKT